MSGAAWGGLAGFGAGDRLDGLQSAPINRVRSRHEAGNGVSGVSINLTYIPRGLIRVAYVASIVALGFWIVMYAASALSGRTADGMLLVGALSRIVPAILIVLFFRLLARKTASQHLGAAGVMMALSILIGQFAVTPTSWFAFLVGLGFWGTVFGTVPSLIVFGCVALLLVVPSSPVQFTRASLREVF